jgi:hypothetical protein
MTEQAYIWIGIAVFVAVLVIVLVVLLQKKHKEGYKKCICSQEQGGRESVCQDINTVKDLYNKNILTEYSTFPSKGWSTVSPGDIQFPQSAGCFWDNSSKEKPQWYSWDFTDF